MNRETIHALVIDRELGELSPESARLLDAYLEEHPEWDHENALTRRTLRLARETVLIYPERGPAAMATGDASRWPVVRWPSLAAAAALVMVAGLGALLGFTWARHSPGKSAALADVAGSPRAPQGSGTVLDPTAPPETVALPWARYEVRPTDRGYTVFPLASSNPIQKP